MPKAKSKIQINNRRASFDYELKGYERSQGRRSDIHPSVRAGKASLADAYCYFDNLGQLYVRNLNISPYFWASWGAHEPKRDRKLLLTRRELKHLSQAVKEKGLTIVAVRLYIAENGYAKLLIALAKGKKVFDKRQSIKEKDIRREMDRS